MHGYNTFSVRPATLPGCKLTSHKLQLSTVDLRFSGASALGRSVTFVKVLTNYVAILTSLLGVSAEQWEHPIRHPHDCHVTPGLRA